MKRIEVKITDAYLDGGTLFLEDAEGNRYYYDGAFKSPTRGKIYPGTRANRGEEITDAEFLIVSEFGGEGRLLKEY